MVLHKVNRHLLPVKAAYFFHSAGMVLHIFICDGISLVILYSNISIVKYSIGIYFYEKFTLAPFYGVEILIPRAANKNAIRFFVCTTSR